MGTDQVRLALEKESAVPDIVAAWSPALEAYQARKEEVHLYAG